MKEVHFDADGVRRWATVSTCGRYRYDLVRVWAIGPVGAVLGINPSTADREIEDHTTRKLIEFGRRWGWGGYVLGNPFAFRATDQRALLTAADPVGPHNDTALRAMVEPAPFVLCAWGSAKTGAVRKLLDRRLAELRPLLEGRRLMCLGTSKDGSPRHPLMLAYDTPLVEWVPPWRTS